MKNLFLGLGVAAFLSIGLFSCSKDYECHCEFSDGTEEEFEYEGLSKSDAKDACEAQEALLSIADPAVDCHLD